MGRILGPPAGYNILDLLWPVDGMQRKEQTATVAVAAGYQAGCAQAYRTMTKAKDKGREVAGHTEG